MRATFVIPVTRLHFNRDGNGEHGNDYNITWIDLGDGEVGSHEGDHT